METADGLPTPQEIAARLREVLAGPRNLFVEIEASRLLEALPWDDAREWFKSPNDMSPNWESRRCYTREDVIQAIRDYLPFAWTKANERRANSAHRSIAHFRGFLFLLGEQAAEVYERLTAKEYVEYYGKPELVAVSEFVGFPWREHDDDEWREGSAQFSLTAEQVLGRP